MGILGKYSRNIQVINREIIILGVLNKVNNIGGKLSTVCRVTMKIQFK